MRQRPRRRRARASTAASAWTPRPSRWSPSAATSTAGAASARGFGSTRPPPALRDAPSAARPRPRLPSSRSTAAGAHATASTSRTDPMSLRRRQDSWRRRFGIVAAIVVSTDIATPRGGVRACSARLRGECWVGWPSPLCALWRRGTTSTRCRGGHIGSRRVAAPGRSCGWRNRSMRSVSFSSAVLFCALSSSEGGQCYSYNQKWLQELTKMFVVN
ncbi:E3 ubiquitin-protein ligase RMA3-like [Iris pallida]|uniref:E3 ubiquitin-protein ligase RMA3-like n=1 Tax=Iris pallida TaxID=29817 RepID=A0AAX6HPJ5_IRIPA|nr:E3 ubiquitin-protein ligase RMA3-like [Iris pallida]